jgi:hypothetical protein
MEEPFVFANPAGETLERAEGSGSISRQFGGGRRHIFVNGGAGPLAGHEHGSRRRAVLPAVHLARVAQSADEFSCRDPLDDEGAAPAALSGKRNCRGRRLSLSGEPN